MKGYRKVLIAVNGSIEVLRQGIRVAMDEGCWATVVKVIPPNEGDLNLTGIRNIEDVLDSGSGRAVAKMKEIATSERVFLKTRIEENNDVSRTIIHVAEEERCDVIVLGTRRPKGLFERWLGDRVVGKVIDGAPCPVLVVGS